MNSRDEIIERLYHIEGKVNSLTYEYGAVTNVAPFSGEDINIIELVKFFWEGRWWIISSILSVVLFALIYAFSLPNMYKAEGVYAPSQHQGAGGLAAQYGGLAAMAGIKLGATGNDDIEQAKILIKSWPFVDKFVEQHQLKPLIMGVDRWDAASGQVLWNSKVYSGELKKWVRRASASKAPEPSSYEVFKKFSSMISVNSDDKTGMITIAIEHYSPIIAADWVNKITDDLNLHFQTRDLLEAKKNIDYLKVKINETGVAEMRAVFYRMIEDQTKKVMLAEVGAEYLLKPVVPPKIAEVKSSPKRLLIIILAAFMGLVLGVAILFIRRISSPSHLRRDP